MDRTEVKLKIFNALCPMLGSFYAFTHCHVLCSALLWEGYNPHPTVPWGCLGLLDTNKHHMLGISRSFKSKYVVFSAFCSLPLLWEHCVPDRDCSFSLVLGIKAHESEL